MTLKVSLGNADSEDLHNICILCGEASQTLKQGT